MNASLASAVATARPRESFSAKFAFLGALALLALLTLLIASIVGLHGWDDGAITLAFARTYAATGRFALTPFSEEVEGFSSFSWFFLNALFAKAGLSFERAILLSQLAAGASAALALHYVYRIALRLRLSAAATALATLLFALNGTTATEIANGMEMTLFAASGLAFVYHLYFEPRPLFALVASAVFLSTRFEAPFHFAFLLAPLILQGRWREAVRWIGVGALIFLSLELYRYACFHELAPNTLFAKLHPPYRKVRLELQIVSRIVAALELFEASWPLLVVTMALAALARYGRGKEIARPTSLAPLALLLPPVASAELFSLLCGKNWGYDGRMQLFALPFLILAACFLLDTLCAHLPARMRWAALVLALATIPISWRNCAGEMSPRLFAGVFGAKPARAELSEVTPAYYRDTGLAMEELRRRLGQETLSFLTADAGGAALCCERLRIVDLAMLCNRALARGGYERLPDVLVAERPDAIEAHRPWSAFSRIFDAPRFKSDYRPALIARTKIYLRGDLWEKLAAEGKGAVCATHDAACVDKLNRNPRYKFEGSEPDELAFAKAGAFLALDGAPP